ncbi:Hypothetical predicted protein [Olea europaea subsp. europaea]|uniref:Uncharacterized protein n=1 Tax=Olea europaea subsp. europaea TaxID=158383 RepID=A0A8S0QKM5_OLEEU|nr:Hypothetical predicted protein [Olea europaea subsp. europaea]
MQPDFQAFLGSLWARCVGHVQDAAILLGISGQFLGHGVQALSGTCSDHGRGEGHVKDRARFSSGAWCAGNVRDASRSQKGCNLISRHLYAVCEHGVPAISKTCSYRGREQPDFQAFLGIFWDSMSRPCQGRVMATVGMEPDFQAILGSFWDTASKACPGCSHVQDTAGTHPDFHVFLGNFFDTVSRQFSGRVGAAAGMQPNL